MKRIIALLSLASSLLAAWAAGDQLNVHETSGRVTSFNASNVDSISFVQGSEQLQKYVVLVPDWYMIYGEDMSVQGTFQPMQGGVYDTRFAYNDDSYNFVFSVYARPSDTFHFEKDGTVLQAWDYDRSEWVDAEWTFGYYPYIIVNVNERPVRWPGDRSMTMSVSCSHNGVPLNLDFGCHVGDKAYLYVDAGSIGESYSFVRNAQISSSNPEVAIVEADHQTVRCLGAGTTTITATAFGETLSVQLEVEEEYVNTDVDTLYLNGYKTSWEYVVEEANIGIESNTAIKAQVTGSLNGISMGLSLYQGEQKDCCSEWSMGITRIGVHPYINNGVSFPTDIKIRIETVHGLVKEIPVVFNQEKWIESRDRYGATTPLWDTVTDQLDVLISGEDIQITVPFSTNESGVEGRWQVQVYVSGGNTIPMQAGKNYKWKVNVNSNKAGFFYSKVTDPGLDMPINNLQMSKEMVAGDNTFTMVVAATENADDVEFCFGLGRNEADMVYTIQMSLVETTEPADEIILPDPEPDTEFVDVSDINMHEVAATWSVLYAAASWGDWNLDTYNVETIVNGNTITYQVHSFPVGNIWYAQLIIGAGLSVAANQAFKISFDIAVDQGCSIQAIMTAGDWDGWDVVPNASELDRITVSSTVKHVELASRGGTAINNLRVSMGLGGCPEEAVYTIRNLKVEMAY